MDDSDMQVPVGDRVVQVWVGGVAGGPVLVFQPGTPAPPVAWPSLESIAASRGLRLVSYARPGYSGSTRHEGRRVVDAATDVAAVLDALDVGEFVTIGHSGGGPHAVACAAVLADRCRAATSLAGVAPHDLHAARWMEGMADENVEEFSIVLEGPAALRRHLSAELAAYAGVTAADVAEALGGLVTAVDRAALTGDLADMVARSLRRAAVDGLDGWIDDDLAVMSPWGFDPAAIDVPVAVWQGRHDAMVPFRHGQWLATDIASAHPRLADDEGHLSLLTRRLGDIVDDLLALGDIPTR